MCVSAYTSETFTDPSARIGPTCKKMQELTPNSVFLASAFQPTPEELIAANRAARSRGPPPPKKRKVEEVITLSAASSSDSDSDLPDLSPLLRSSPKDKSASGSKKVAVKSKAKGKKASSSDMEDDSDTDSPFAKGQTKAKGKASAKGKGKEKDNNGAPGQPNEAMLKMWRQGGTNVESSAKMLQMVEYLKEWESTGDKTIVFSQCTYMLLQRGLPSSDGRTNDRRDVNAQFVRRDLCASWDSKPAL